MDYAAVPAPGDEPRLSVVLALGTPSLVTASGESDHDVVAELGRALDRALEHHPHVVLDLAGITFADSALLNALLLARQTAVGRQGDVRLATTPSTCVRRLLELTGTSALFPAATGGRQPERS